MRQAMNDKAAITPSQATPGRPVWVPLPSTGAWVRGLIDGLKWDEGTSGYVACVRIAALGIGRLYFTFPLRQLRARDPNCDGRDKPEAKT